MNILNKIKQLLSENKTDEHSVRLLMDSIVNVDEVYRAITKLFESNNFSSLKTADVKTHLEKILYLYPTQSSYVINKLVEDGTLKQDSGNLIWVS